MAHRRDGRSGSPENQISGLLCEIPGFIHCVVEEACARLGCYASWVRFLYHLKLKDGTDMLSRNVGYQQPTSRNVPEE
jgi:hypothetical protein